MRKSTIKIGDRQFRLKIWTNEIFFEYTGRKLLDANDTIGYISGSMRTTRGMVNYPHLTATIELAIIDKIRSISK